MKSPKPKSPPAGKAGDKSVWSERNAGKVLDVVKQGTSTLSSVAGVFSEKEKTRQAELKAQADIASAKEETKRVQLKTFESLAKTDRKMRKDDQAHERAMAELHNQHVLNLKDSDRRDRVVDKLLEGGNADLPTLAQGLRGLLPNDDR
jgi:hypothetical protein